MSLTVGPEDDETELLGKYVEDLQEEVRFVGNRITGTLNYVDDYTGFSGETEEQSGHYLAIKVSDTPDGATTTIQLIGAESTPQPIELDEDMNAVIRITDPLNQKLKVVCEVEGYQRFEQTYRLSGLTLKPEE